MGWEGCLNHDFTFPAAQPLSQTPSDCARPAVD